MRVLSVASECAPLVKTGGLADVAGALPAALAPEGVEMRVLMPAYRGLASGLENARRTAIDLDGQTVELVLGQAAGMSLILIDVPALFDRDGGPYQRPDGRDWPDNHRRFALLARVGARIAAGGLGGWRPDAVHAHDWQAGLVPVYLAHVERGGPPVLLTIHNIAFQGLFPRSVMPEIGLPTAAFDTASGVEFWGKVGFLKGGLALADRITTVSPSYARELTTPAFGGGLDGLLRHRAGDLSGVLNGIDTELWNPETDPAIAAPFSARLIGGKARNRRALAARFRLKPRRDAPLFVVISRLTRQKGLDLLLDCLPDLIDRGACLAVLGSGDEALEQGFAAAARDNPARIGAVLGYDEALSHLMQAGADAILVPSRFEPCGLTQLYAQRYGTIPVAARTGGLGDTIVDANPVALGAGVATGLLHAPDSPDALSDAIARASDLHRDSRGWSTMRRNAMRLDLGWRRSAAAYAGLYAGMVSRTREAA